MGLAVKPDHLLPSGHYADLMGGLPALRNMHPFGGNVPPSEEIQKRVTLRIISNKAKWNSLCPKSQDVPYNVPRTSRNKLLPVELHDRDRGFRGNPFYVTKKVSVQDKVPQHCYPDILQAQKNLAGIILIQERQRRSPRC